MSRKDYVLIADSLRLSGELHCNSLQDHRILKTTIYELANRLAYDNDRFDTEKFLKAAGVFNPPAIPDLKVIQ